jgi:predicted PurR-regulated permease PerM
MAKSSIIPVWQRALIVQAGTFVAVVVVGCLYWAQEIFIPLALAIFLAFLLNPFVRGLQRRGLGRIPSVIVVGLLASLLLGGLGWLVTWQATNLLNKLPDYSVNIQRKIHSLRDLGSGSERLEQFIAEIGEAWKSTTPGKEGTPPVAPVPSQTGPTAVVPQPSSLPWIGQLPGYLGSAAPSVVGLALALILAIFMLVKREDLRNRFISLVGQQNMTETTKAIDDTGERISRYLLMQLVVNATYGLAWGVGLLLIGVEYALLWGFLAAVVRYVPYLGPWIAGLMPITMSLAMFPGWWQPLLVIGLFLVLELVSNNLMEPWLYGHSMGVSEVAQLVSAATWAFLWGPIGLVLSAPLTVVLLVLGKHIPQLRFLEVILGDEPTLDPDVAFYQRLLARDQDEATQLVLTHAKASPLEKVYDELLLPALNATKRDRDRGELTEDDEQFVLQATRDIVADLGERQVAAAEKTNTLAENALAALPKVRFLGCSGHDEADALALEMLRQTLDPARWDVELLSWDMVTAEPVTLAGKRNPAVVCIGALPPGGLARTRFLCKRLRSQLPHAKVVVGRWGLKSTVEHEYLREAGADQIGTTLVETLDQLRAWLPPLDKGAAETTPAVAVPLGTSAQEKELAGSCTS